MAGEDLLRAALERLADPVSGKDIVSAGRVSGIVLRSGQAGLVLAVDGLSAHDARTLEARVDAALRAVPGVGGARIITTAERGDAPQGPHPTAPATLPEIRHIIAVGSGKGGVGKSTVAANLAVALAAQGLKVGLLDADIYGPSVPMLLGRQERLTLREKLIQPAEVHGLKAVSMGAMTDPDRAVVWRGPMASSALMQMLTQTEWGPLDVLVVDLPPGTGDIQLTMAQKVPLAGAVIVSTPQDLALIDAKKAVAMFGKVGVPILGMIENMSTFRCPNCGHESHIFGHGGAEEAAAAMGIAFLGGIPLEIGIREASDAGTPVALRGDAAGNVFRHLAVQIQEALKENPRAAHVR
ncbi:Mrp/NBP35 family ATP-binding protein [Sphingosinicella microcystinivorans]|uniref:Mrp/NBP35 family ATP-binding protein n=1 Tax=Sphingosinicella microcystinivorans TaxID=335406 RepID=UPI0022F3A8B1|nr:Mrp/NBP35 family ATP-binding protein [Sphingosinicella microcystinivorans]WBX85696.1 Mrp/NBP35 family ATP-binding protein [Sphingosinicella microcystinivorans]